MMTAEEIIIVRLVHYAYSIGGNTRSMAEVTGIPPDEVADMMVVHPDALTCAGGKCPDPEIHAAGMHRYPGDGR